LTVTIVVQAVTDLYAGLQLRLADESPPLTLKRPCATNPKEVRAALWPSPRVTLISFPITVIVQTIADLRLNRVNDTAGDDPPLTEGLTYSAEPLLPLQDAG